ncbi:MAG: hypothetical protein U0361_13325 [Nitrospiraceae bacterium]
MALFREGDADGAIDAPEETSAEPRQADVTTSLGWSISAEATDEAVQAFKQSLKLNARSAEG